MKLLLVAGARPNFMKIAPLIHAIHRHNARLAHHAPPSPPRSGRGQGEVSNLPLSASESPLSAFSVSASDSRSSVLRPPSSAPVTISYKLVHTGQHYDEKMSEVFFRELGIPKPDVNLEVGSGSHAVQTANLMLRFEPVLLNAFRDPSSISPLRLDQSPRSRERERVVEDQVRVVGDAAIQTGEGQGEVSNLPLSASEPPLSAFSVSAFEKPVVSGPSPSVLGPPSSVSSSVVSGLVVTDPSPSASEFPLSAFSVSAFEKSSAPSPNFSSQLSAFSFGSALPDWLLVVGDVNSTMACTLVASKLGVKVAHVEAGLRSGDRTMPEEINRLVTDALADLLLTPSEDANANLRREGVAEQKIKMVGNIMIDSLIANLPQARASTILQDLHLQPGNYVYVTLHRPSNVDQKESLSLIMTELSKLSCQLPVVFPIHPRTRKMLADFGITVPPLNSPPSPPRSGRGQGEVSNSPLPPSSASAPISACQHVSVSAFENCRPSTLNPQLLLLEPLGYHDSLCLTEQARLVLTDSGGLQEESTYFRTPCLTLRPNTERPITVTQGSNRLTTLATLAADIRERLGDTPRLGAVPAFWDGHTAERIVETLIQLV